MTTLSQKRPTEVRNYIFDFSRELTDDPITAFDVVVTSGAIVIQGQNQQSDYVVTALIAGGVNGATSTLELQFTTNAGQVIIRDYSLLTANASAGGSTLPSSTTKGQIVNMAFEEITLAGYEFDATPAEQASALQRLDSLAAFMAGPGVNMDLWYNSPAAIGGSSLTDESGIPDMALEYIVTELALSLCPAIGKTLGAEARLRRAQAKVAIRAALARIPHVRLPAETIRGAGAKPWSTWRPFQGGWGSSNAAGSGQAQPQTEALSTESGELIGTENGGIVGV